MSGCISSGDTVAIRASRWLLMYSVSFAENMHILRLPHAKSLPLLIRGFSNHEKVKDIFAVPTVGSQNKKEGPRWAFTTRFRILPLASQLSLQLIGQETSSC